MAGKLLSIIYTDFDTKLLSEAITNWCAQHDSQLIAAPAHQQNQNGLVERSWQMISNMTRSYINNKQMPRSIW